jgi:hypothetical protein
MFVHQPILNLPFPPCCWLFFAAMPTAWAIKRRLQGHPNMVVTHEVFEDAEGFHIILEYIPGPTLDDLISDTVRSHMGGTFLDIAQGDGKPQEVVDSWPGLQSQLLYVKEMVGTSSAFMATYN